MVQWLSLQAPNVGGPGCIPGHRARYHVLHLRPGITKWINNKIYIKSKTCMCAHACSHTRDPKQTNKQKNNRDLQNSSHVYKTYSARWASRWAQLERGNISEQTAGRIPLEVLEEHPRTTKLPLLFYSQHQFPLKIYLEAFSFKVIFLLRSMLLLLLHIYSFYFQDCALRKFSSPQKTPKLSRTCQNGILSTYPVETVSRYLALTFFIILCETMLYHTRDMSSWTPQRKKYWKRSVKMIFRI